MRAPYLILTFILLFTFNTKAKKSNTNFEKGVLLVQVNHNFSASTLEETFSACDLIVEKRISRYMDIWKICFNDEACDHKSLTADLLDVPEILIAQNNHVIEKRQTFPNDNVPWQFHNTNGTDADVDGPEAWDYATGGFNVQGDRIVIALVDGGYDVSDTDYDFYINPGESATPDGIDNDGNGWVDDYQGWNVIDQNGYHDINAGHGQFVSAVAGRLGNNGQANTGINWNCQIMPIEIFKKNNLSWEDRALEAMDYIITMRDLYDQTNGAQGAFIVSTNHSYGQAGMESDAPLWCMSYATAGTYGILSAGATDNNLANVDVVGDLPTGCSQDHLITVTNTTNTDTWSDSGYGLTMIDLGCPSNGSTSEATPVASGIIALLHAGMCDSYVNAYKANPEAVALVLKDYLLNGTDPMADLQGITVTGGRANAFNSMALMLSEQCGVAFPPVPSFSSDFNTVCAGETVQFTDGSTLNPNTWQWSFQGGSPATSSTQNPSVQYNSPGVYDVSLTVSNADGSNSTTVNGMIEVINVTGLNLPYTQDFESGNDWNIDNPNNDQTWDLVSGDNCNGQVIAIDNFNNNNQGTSDDLSLSFDLSSVSNASLSFDVAYARYDASFFDGLEIFVDECGFSPVSVFFKEGDILATAPDVTTDFIPADCSEWRNETVDLSAYDGENIILTFQSQSGWGNWIYLDNINIIGDDCPASISFDAGIPSSTINPTPIALNATPAGGTWSGPGVVFSAFNPGIAGPGFHSLTYSYDDGNGCILSGSVQILVASISYNFVNYNLGTISPE